MRALLAASVVTALSVVAVAGALSASAQAVEGRTMVGLRASAWTARTTDGAFVDMKLGIGADTKGVSINQFVSVRKPAAPAVAAPADAPLVQDAPVEQAAPDAAPVDATAVEAPVLFEQPVEYPAYDDASLAAYEPVEAYVDVAADEAAYYDDASVAEAEPVEVAPSVEPAAEQVAQPVEQVVEPAPAPAPVEAAPAPAPAATAEPAPQPVSDASEAAPAQETAGVAVEGDRDAFVSEWGARIDSYLDGGELAGYGETFASAAYDYGVDPRFSPAISMVESTQGQYCFLPYNAWGWGDSCWESWDEAIYDHVEGLSIGYGSTLDYDDGEKYCPGTDGAWYDAVSTQMEQI